MNGNLMEYAGKKLTWVVVSWNCNDNRSETWAKKALLKIIVITFQANKNGEIPATCSRYMFLKLAYTENNANFRNGKHYTTLKFTKWKSIVFLFFKALYITFFFKPEINLQIDWSSFFVKKIPKKGYRRIFWAKKKMNVIWVDRKENDQRRKMPIKEQTQVFIVGLCFRWIRTKKMLNGSWLF